MKHSFLSIFLGLHCIYYILFLLYWSLLHIHYLPNMVWIFQFYHLPNSFLNTALSPIKGGLNHASWSLLLLSFYFLVFSLLIMTLICLIVFLDMPRYLLGVTLSSVCFATSSGITFIESRSWHSESFG